MSTVDVVLIPVYLDQAERDLLLEGIRMIFKDRLERASRAPLKDVAEAMTELRELEEKLEGR